MSFTSALVLFSISIGVNAAAGVTTFNDVRGFFQPMYYGLHFHLRLQYGTQSSVACPGAHYYSCCFGATSYSVL